MKQILLSLVAILFCCCSSDSDVKAEVPVGTAKTLVVYYSYTGNCREIVNTLTSQIQADVLEIQPAEKGLRYEANNYALGMQLLTAIKADPDNESSYPAIDPVNVSLSHYQNIIIVTPLWWSQMAAIMQTYLFQIASQVEGKHVGLIVSSHSSGISGVVSDAQRLLPHAAWMGDALWIHAGNHSQRASLIENWLGTLTFAEERISKDKMYITIGGVTQSVTLVDNAATRELIAALHVAPITITLSDNKFEVWGSLGRTLPTHDEPTDAAPGDMVLYGGSNRTYTNRQAQNTVGAKATLFDNRLRLNADFTYRVRTYDTHVHRLPSPFSRYEGVIESLADIKGLADYISETLRTYDYLSTNEFVEYEDSWGKHNFKALVGYNYEQQVYKNTYAYNDGLLSPNVDNINLALGLDNKSITGDYSKWRTAGAFFRFNYNYAERYLFEVNGRYDGSSKFPARQRWAFFPSISAGWRLSEEPWFNVDKRWISNIKIRGSYGSLGNSNVGVYAYDETFDFDNGRIINGQKVRYTSAPSPIPESLTWETAQTLDGGVDLSFFSGRLNFTGDIYRRKTLNMYTVGPTLPDVFGASSPKGNYAEMTTRGFELSLSWEDAFNLGGKPFTYGLRATLADYYSIIDKYNNALKSLGDNAYNTSYYEGMRLGEIWGYVANGLYQSQAEIDADEARAKEAGQAHFNPRMQQTESYTLYPGDIKFEDLNNNGYIDRGKNTAEDSGDRKIIGNSEPRYIYSFGIDLGWNGFYANAFFQGVGKQDWFPDNESSTFWGMYNRPYNQMPSWHLNNYWTEDNPNAYLPRYTGYFAPFYKGRVNANTLYLQNASYIRLKSVQFGYTLPEKLTRKAGMQKVSIFLAGENLWTWSPVYRHTRDIDVTANIYGTDSVLSTTGDGYNFPTMKSLSIGLKMTFGHFGDAVRKAAKPAYDAAAIAALMAKAEKAEADAKAAEEKYEKLVKVERENAFYPVFFELNNSELTDLEKVHVRDIVRRINAEDPYVKFSIRGNADAGTGTVARNAELSQQRVDNVIAYMKELGVDPDRFTVNTGLGFDRDSELDRCVIIEKL